MRFVTDNPVKTANVLRSHGYSVHETEVIAVSMLTVYTEIDNEWLADYNAKERADMEKNRWQKTLILLSLVLMVGLASGCITITVPKKSVPQATVPIVNSFAASPVKITAGQRTTLTWDVSGATTVTIQPEIGGVGASGSVQLAPPVTTTYILTATNAAGSTHGLVTVTVTKEMSRPDLVITDIWLEGKKVYYKIKNEGNASSKPSRTQMYVNNLMKATEFEDPLAAGQEKITSFSNFGWEYGSLEVFSTQIVTYNVKVCADMNNEVEEADESNNCLIQIWGQKYSYDFVKNAHLAKWRSNAGELKWPMVSYDKKGAAYRLYDALVLCPEQAGKGWIVGRFADFYDDPETHAARSRLIEVPEKAKFTAKVGFEPNVRSTDGVRVAFGYLDATGSMVLFPMMDVYSDGALHPYEVDLGSLAGKKTEFVLWVEAKDSPEGDCVKWVEPKVVQE